MLESANGMADRLHGPGVVLTAIGLATLLMACGGSDETRVTTTASPAPENSRLPFLAAAGERLLLMWTETRDDGPPRVRLSAFDGRRWNEPTTLVEEADLFVNWADFPSLISLDEQRLAAHWLIRQRGHAYAYDVVLAGSEDGGSSWTALGRPHRDGSAAEHGFVSLTAEGDGRLGVVWLDGREMSGGGPMRLMYTRWNDGSFEDERVLDPDVCSCCQTSAASLGGDLLVAYRGHARGEIRDILLVRRVDGEWSKPRVVHADGWKIGACPVNGPALDARGEDVAVAWFTAASADPRVLVAFSSDGGRRFAPPLRLDGGDPIGRVDLEMLADGSVAVSWLEAGADGAELRVRRVSSTAPLGPASILDTTGKDRSSGFPRLEQFDGALWAAWTDDSRPPRVALSRIEF